MIKAKDCVRSLSPWMVACLGLGLSLLEVGCSGISGFRSVGTERPSLLGFWDRSGPGSPAPENDTYAQRMRAGQSRAEAIAGTSDQPASSRDAAQTGGAAGAEPSGSRQGSAPAGSAVADETIRVSLGRPEPLPGLALAAAPESLASTATTSRWKAETKGPAPDGGPGVSQPVERPDREGTATDRLAERAEPSPRAEPASKPDSNALLSRAAIRLDALRTYQVKISRLERVNGQLQPEEDILLSIRRDPKAVRLEWSSGPNKGREVIYSNTLDPRMIFVHMPSTAIPLPAMKIPVDSPLVMRNSRHAITEAGFDTLIENLRKSAGRSGENRSDSGDLRYQGLAKPAGLDRACHYFVRRTASGETWNVYFDSHSLLPCMVLAEDSRGELIERYIYREIRENPTELAAAGAFEPDQRWGESKGFLSRFARAATGPNLPSSSGSTTR